MKEDSASSVRALLQVLVLPNVTPCALRKPKQNGFLSHLRLDAQNAGILERSFKKKSLHLPERGQKYRSSMMKRESDSNPDLNCVR